jgi:formylglycine-generating enzyme required for sulfatase activity
MLAIPGGEFLMGASDDENGDDREKPQHLVTVPPFYLGRVPVTQVQWRFIAGLRKVDRDLSSNPSHFKGDDLPVERVSWNDAVEFCARLSRHTGRAYRLPTEAEWEYACRAGTTTPFHFGETLNTDVANYDGNYTYSSGRKGKYREKTTPVGSLSAANAWGLLDMHGNVWEWCEDDRHSSYDDAPTDGNAWLDSENESSTKNINKNSTKIIRGGSWDYDPRNCRSAIRYSYSLDDRDDNTGFRVACAAPRLS